MIKIDTRISQELKDLIKLRAKEQGRTFCGQVRWMLEQQAKPRVDFDFTVRNIKTK